MMLCTVFAVQGFIICFPASHYKKSPCTFVMQGDHITY